VNNVGVNNDSALQLDQSSQKLAFDLVVRAGVSSGLIAGSVFFDKLFFFVPAPIRHWLTPVVLFGLCFAPWVFLLGALSRLMRKISPQDAGGVVARAEAMAFAIALLCQACAVWFLAGSRGAISALHAAITLVALCMPAILTLPTSIHAASRVSRYARNDDSAVLLGLLIWFGAFMPTLGYFLGPEGWFYAHVPGFLLAFGGVLLLNQVSSHPLPKTPATKNAAPVIADEISQCPMEEPPGSELNFHTPKDTKHSG
jgi:hypothetical protein